MKRAIATAMICGAATIAQAQESELGSRITKPREQTMVYGSGAAQRGARQMAACLVHRRQSAASAMLDAADDAGFIKADRALSRETSDCLSITTDAQAQTGVRMQASRPLWRGLVAEQLVMNRFATAAPAPEPIQRRYASAWTAIDGRGAVIDEMAVCASSTNPAGVRALLVTEPASPAEATAMGALSPTLGQCLAAGATLQGNRQSIRAALAEALYHRLAAPGAPS